MSSENLNKDIIEKCRLCLNIEHQMNPFFEPIYEAQEENGSVFVSLAHVMKSISNIELDEYEFQQKNICGSCTMTILNFNNLMKVFQDTQEELKKLLSVKNNDNEDGTLDNSIEKIIIETYDVGSQVDEDSFDSYNHNVSDNPILNNKMKDCEENHIIDIQQDTLNLSDAFKKETRNLEHPWKTGKGTEIITKKYSCNECGDIFLIKSGFSHHMLQKHNICILAEQFNEYSSDVKITIPVDCSDNAFKFVQKIPSQPKKKYQFQCQICKQGFESKADLKLHYDIHRTIKCNQCGAAFIKNSYLKDHMLMHSNEKKYVCEVCGKAFRYRNGLAVHKTIHSNHKAHICDVCGQGFNAKTTLLTHITLKHGTNEKKYACSECHLVFKVKSWLDKHFQRRHTINRTKDFICSVCGISYLNKYTLTRHINDKHLGNGKRYSCHICEKSYTMKNKLLSHMQIKHSTVLS